MTEQTKNEERDGHGEASAEPEEALHDTDGDDQQPHDDGPVAVGGQAREHPPSRKTLLREDRRKRSVARKSRRKLMVGIGGGLIAAALITGLVLPSIGSLGGSSSNASETAQGSPASVGTQLPIQQGSLIEFGAEHEAYSSSPPTSGPRYAEAVEWGAHDTQQPDEAIVRNLEDGGIVANYNLSDPATVDDLEAFLELQPGYPGCFVMQPYDTVAPGSVTLTSWGWLATYDAADSSSMQEFISDHLNAGPRFLSNTCGAEIELPSGDGG